jgi:hypothetical protein
LTGGRDRYGKMFILDVICGYGRMLLLLDLEAAADQTIPSTECVSCSVDNVHKGFLNHLDSLMNFI